MIRLAGMIWPTFFGVLAFFCILAFSGVTTFFSVLAFSGVTTFFSVLAFFGVLAVFGVLAFFSVLTFFGVISLAAIVAFFFVARRDHVVGAEPLSGFIWRVAVRRILRGILIGRVWEVYGRALTPTRPPEEEGTANEKGV
jgi:hypothetical protein